MKHAWMIMAHNNFASLKKLVLFLDEECNDIYLHIDKKSRKAFKQFLAHEKMEPKRAGMHFVEPGIDIEWGGHSQIQCELLLLEKAVAGGTHAYYHLLSGNDMPIKPFAHIKNFFEETSGFEFVSFQKTDYRSELQYKIGVYHYFQNIIGRKRRFYARVLRRLEKLSITCQKKLGVDRNARAGFIDVNCVGDYKKGNNWFSITEPLAQYVLSQKEQIMKRFRYTECADEIFLQTLVWHSEWKSRLYQGQRTCLRYIDWTRGIPYTFLKSDFDELMKEAPCDALFARKFDEKTDNEIIDMIYEVLRKG